MELNWSTFLLEIINFLVLVWILKYFFYKPVLDVIARRRAGIEKTLTEAKALHDDAEKMQEQYENRIAEWEKEKDAAREELDKEIDIERTQRMKELQLSLEQERKKAGVVEQRRLNEIRAHMEETALTHGAKFSARLLSKLTGPELEKNLIELLLKDLPTLAPNRLEELRSAINNTMDKTLITSAYPLDENIRQRLEQVVTESLKVETPFIYKLDKDLLAGVRINVGAWVFRANVQDELESFAELAHEP